MSLSKFIGREVELSRLKGLIDNRSASLMWYEEEDELARADFLQNLGKK